MRRWRRKAHAANRRCAAVFEGERYGIFDLYELFVLIGYPLKRIAPELGSREEIFRRYGIEPPEPP